MWQHNSAEKRCQCVDVRAGTCGTVRSYCPALRAEVRAVYKSGVLREYEVQKYVRFENGYNADVFGLRMIAALAFRINTLGAEQVRTAIIERLCLQKEKTSIIFSLGINNMKITKYQT